MRASVLLLLVGTVSIIGALWLFTTLYASYQYREISAKLYNAQDKLADLNKKVENLTETLNLKDREISSKSNELKECFKHLSYYVNESVDADIRIQELSRNLTNKSKELSKLRAELNARNKEVEELNKKVEEYEITVANLTERNENLTDTLAQVLFALSDIEEYLEEAYNRTDDEDVKKALDEVRELKQEVG